MPGELAEDGLRAWVPVSHMGDQIVVVFGLAQPNVYCGHLGKWMENVFVSPSVYVALHFK